MSLSAALHLLFSGNAKERGRGLASRVRFDEDWDPHARLSYARVQGTSDYDLCVDEEDAVAAGWCTCPAFGHHGPCKHMWAAVLRIDEARSGGEQHALDNSAAIGLMLDDSGEFSVARPTDVVPTHHQEETTRRILDAPVRSADSRLNRLRQRGNLFAERVDLLHSATHQLHFVITQSTDAGSATICSVAPITRSRLATGEWGRPRGFDLDVGDFDWSTIPVADQRDYIAMAPYIKSAYRDFLIADVPSELAEDLLPAIAARGRLLVSQVRGSMVPDSKDLRLVAPLDLDGDEELEFEPKIEQVHEDAIALSIDRPLPNAADGSQLEFVDCVVGPKLLVLDGRLRRWSTSAPSGVVADLLFDGPLLAPQSDRLRLEALLEVPIAVPPADGPSPELHLENSLLDLASETYLRGTLRFRYAGEAAESFVIHAEQTTTVVQIGDRLYRRDVQAEQACLDTLVSLGGVIHYELGGPRVSVVRKNVSAVLRRLLDAGFEIFAAKERVRTVTTTSVRVESGIDWFEVQAQVNTNDGENLEVPDLLAGVRNKADFVRLKLGEIALLDEATKDLTALARLGSPGQQGGLRFGANQGFLLDALLQAREFEVQADRKFRAIRKHAAQGLSVRARTEPAGFGATLRPYQRDSLGWFEFLRKLGVGGCLADDMGLGKTVQVLAMLEQQRRRRPKPGPSLVVAPRSLLFHWHREAERFAPKIRTLIFHGAQRKGGDVGRALASAFDAYDLVITTYGTLRIDAAQLHDIHWHYLVLDESQAIKNDRSQASKAVRACRAEHRLALSGTPIENHLGELWALFEFLNPGMLGASSTFRRLMKGGNGKRASGGDAVESANWTQALRGAVRPFMLRRTKDQVLTDLPDKTVQVLDCELKGAQKRSYDQLAAHYRALLLGDLDEGKLPDKMRFVVLEALLRLRQAACHPGLIDDARSAEACAKFDVLWPMLVELREEGHKALVFSQFPSFLTLLRARLEEEGIDYAYLDGKTRKRKEEVDRFQSDDDCGLFLISIKAGGHGLNLTAASYVFLLDPWWNPAVESQAIDRAHRIGQSRKVHAYRLIVRDTVEERVAELQEHKRRIAESVLGDDTSVLQDLTAADVAALLR